jgi:hypothetical protein
MIFSRYPTVALVLMATACSSSVISANDGNDSGAPGGGNGGVASAAYGGSSGTGGAGGSSAAGGTGGAVAGPDPSSLVGLSFNLSVDDAGGIRCGDGVLHVLGASGSVLSIVFGTPGHAETGTLTLVGSGYHLDAPLTFSSSPRGNNMCDAFTRLTGATITFAPGGDGGAVALALTGTWSSQHCGDDFMMQPADFAVTGVGTLDKTAPTLSGQPAVHDPLSTISLIASEPLEKNATALLADTLVDSARPLEQVLENSVVVGFKSDLVLPFGGSYLVNSSAADLAGNSSPVVISFSTPAEPGVLSPDGFESGGLTGVASLVAQPVPTVVTGIAGVPAISGARSLYLPSGASVLLHLQRAAAETKVVLKVRKLVLLQKPQANDGALYLAAGAVGGTKRANLSVAATATSQPGTLADGTPVKISDVQDVALTMEDAGTNVIVRIAAEYFAMSYSSSAAALIDDVHLE